MTQVSNVSDLVAFIATVEAGSFARGALRLGRSRSAVAKAVARLEQRVGTRLLARTTRHLALTEDGREFHVRCSSILEELEAAEAAVGQRGGVPRGTLRISAPDAYGRLHLLPVVHRYLQRWPDVQVELGLSDRLSGIVEEGIDLAIRLGQPYALSPDLVTRMVGQCCLGFYASPAYLQARGQPGGLADLSHHDCIPYNVGPRRRRWRALSADGVWNELPGRARLSVDSGDAMLRAALLGLGIAYMPDFLAMGAVANGQLKQVLSDMSGAELPIVAIYPSRRNLPAKVRMFIDLLVDALPDSRGDWPALGRLPVCSLWERQWRTLVANSLPRPVLCFPSGRCDAAHRTRRSRRRGTAFQRRPMPDEKGSPMSDQSPANTSQRSNATVAHRLAEAFARHGAELTFGQSLPSAFHLAVPSVGIRQIVYRQENAGGAAKPGLARPPLAGFARA